MAGGIAVHEHLLCWAATDARGRVLLLDLDDQSFVASWSYRSDEGGFADAAGVTFGADHAVLVADPRNARVLRFSPFGRRIGQIGAAARAGVAERPGVLDRPHAVAWHDGTTYVACGDMRLDYGVQRFGPHDEALPPLRSHGVAGRRFGAPRALHADADGLWVADTLEGTVQRFDHIGSFRHAFATTPSARDASRPIGLTTRAGLLWVLDVGDRHALRAFTPGGELHASHELSALRLEHPIAIAAGAGTPLFVLDRDGDRLSAFDEPQATPRWQVEFAEFLHGDF